MLLLLIYDHLPSSFIPFLSHEIIEHFVLLYPLKRWNSSHDCRIRGQFLDLRVLIIFIITFQTHFLKRPFEILDLLNHLFLRNFVQWRKPIFLALLKRFLELLIILQIFLSHILILFPIFNSLLVPILHECHISLQLIQLYLPHFLLEGSLLVFILFLHFPKLLFLLSCKFIKSVLVLFKIYQFLRFVHLIQLRKTVIQIWHVLSDQKNGFPSYRTSP
jgi:hypothetical protein